MTPILVSILRCNKTGGCLWPDFDLVPERLRYGLHWTKYIDAYGIGWHYDQESPLGQADAENPERNVWYAGTLVPDDFARKARELFPERVTLLDESTWAKFWEERVTKQEEDETVHLETLQVLLAKVQLEEKGLLPPPSGSEKAKRKRALDPDQPERGIQRNLHKRWATAKRRWGL